MEKIDEEMEHIVPNDCQGKKEWGLTFGRFFKLYSRFSSSTAL
jgi:hypothetical protein